MQRNVTFQTPRNKSWNAPTPRYLTSVSHAIILNMRENIFTRAQKKRRSERKEKLMNKRKYDYCKLLATEENFHAKNTAKALES